MYWNEKPYHSLDYEMKRIYGHKIYKLALDGGMTCPNRDAKLSFVIFVTSMCHSS